MRHNDNAAAETERDGDNAVDVTTEIGQRDHFSLLSFEEKLKRVKILEVQFEEQKKNELRSMAKTEALKVVQKDSRNVNKKERL